MTARSGICPVCGRTIRLKVDGTVFHHSAARPASRYRRPDCAGTNQLPNPEDDTDDNRP